MPDQRILLRRTCSAFSPGEFFQQETYWNQTRRVREVDPAARTFSCSVYTRPAGEVERYCLTGADAGTLRLVLFDPAAASDISYQDTPDSPACPVGNTLTLEAELLPLPSTAADGADRTIRVTVGSTAWPVRVFGTGLETRTLYGGGQAEETTDYVVPARAGRYTVQARDAAGYEDQAAEIVIEAPSGGPDALLPPGGKWLRYELFLTSEADPGGGLDREYWKIEGWYYDPATRLAVRVVEEVGGVNFPVSYSRDTLEEIDRYDVDARTRRKVYHNGTGGLRFEDTVEEPATESGTLRILNIIQNDPDDPAAPATGSVWVEAESPTPPLTYTLTHDTAPARTNTTGQFASLELGAWQVSVQDGAGNTVTDSFTLTAAPRPRWVLAIDNLSGVPIRYVISERGYTGEPEAVCGDGSPVTRGWRDTSTEPRGNIAESAGQSVTLRLRTQTPRQFQAIAESGDDRKYRLDCYANEQLTFRGYLVADLYTEPLLGAGQVVELTATDGLGSLSDTLYRNHRGRPMEGRRPLLALVLHCLSRCDVALPLHCGLNLRDVGMEDDADPLLESWARREAYADPGEDTDLRSVLDAALRPLSGLLTQQNGVWRLISPNEVDTDYAVRAYAPNGQALPPPARPARWGIRRAGRGNSSRRLEWREAAQQVRVVPPAAAVQARVDLLFVDSLFPDPTFQLWNTARTAPLGWSTQNYPLTRQAGAKARTYKLELPPVAQAAGEQWLLSPPVAVEGGADAAPLLLLLKCRVNHPPRTDGLTDEEFFMRTRVVVQRDGVPDPEELSFEWSSKAKETEQSALLPEGPGGIIRLRLLPPERTGPTLIEAPVEVLELKLQVLPQGVYWPEDDQVTVENPRPAYIVGDEVELVHADIPRFPLDNSLPAPFAKMEALAWRHALTLADGRPTSSWQRPTSLRPAPLLESAALDRLELIAGPVEVIAGPVTGPDVYQLAVGDVLDATDDTDGRFLVVGCSHEERTGRCELTARRLRSGDFTGAATLPPRVRVSQLGPRINQLGYRVV